MPRRSDAGKWIDGYVKAWNSNHPDDIAALFTEDAVYKTGPYDVPWEGRDEIVRGWLARKDEPGNATFRYEIVAARDDLVVVEGRSRYRDPDTEYANLWLFTLDERGRCKSFLEYWMERD